MPEALKKLIASIGFLPGIGEKTATKLAFFLLKANPSYLSEFESALGNIQKETQFCEECGAIVDKNISLCPVCRDEKRDHTHICVVEDWLDMIALEKTGAFKGIYHILWGSISPASGVTPKDLAFEKLFARITRLQVQEVLLATNPNFEGEATALYAKEGIEKLWKNIRMTRLSRGLPNAGYIEYADEATLLNALRGRKDM